MICKDCYEKDDDWHDMRQIVVTEKHDELITRIILTLYQCDRCKRIDVE